MVGYTRIAFQRMASAATVATMGGSAIWYNNNPKTTKNDSDSTKTVMNYLSEIHSKASVFASFFFLGLITPK